MDRLESKIRGCILGAAAGDAMGAPTEAKSTAQIIEIFGKRVEEFQTPPKDVQARGRRAGQVTDAFSIPYMLTKALLDNGGKASKELGQKVLMDWSETEYFEPFAGMTTRKVITMLNKQKTLNTWNEIGHLGNKLFVGHYYALSSNGAAVKAYPLGLIHRGCVDDAICDTIEMTCASHDDQYSISGACAVAAAVAEAMKEETSVYQIIQAARYGSVQGEELARRRGDIHIYPGPSVTKRIDMAIEIALHKALGQNPTEEIRDRIGSGPAIAETVPAALGIILANRGRTMDCIYDVVNMGDETCAIASIVGAICGTYNGWDSFPEDYLPFLNKENNIDIGGQAKAVYQLCQTLS